MTRLPPTHAPQSHTSPNPPPPPKGSLRRGRFLGPLTPRTIAAPLAAFTMAILLYTYSVTSIRAAKRNAALHRAADGGQLDMRRESLRRHGVLDKVEGTKGLELFRDARGNVDIDGGEGGDTQIEGEAAVRVSQARSGTIRQMVEKDEEGRARTEVESGLEGWKGREGQDKWKSSPPVRSESRGRLQEDQNFGMTRIAATAVQFYDPKQALQRVAPLPRCGHDYLGIPEARPLGQSHSTDSDPAHAAQEDKQIEAIVGILTAGVVRRCSSPHGKREPVSALTFDEGTAALSRPESRTLEVL